MEIRAFSCMRGIVQDQECVSSNTHLVLVKNPQLVFFAVYFTGDPLYRIGCMAIGDIVKNSESSDVGPLQWILMAAGVFAIGAIGFCAAVFLGVSQSTPAAPTSIPIGQETTTTQKQQLLQQVQDSSASASSTSTPSATSTSAARQSQTIDSNASGGMSAAQKQKLLEELNAH